MPGWCVSIPTGSITVSNYAAVAVLAHLLFQFQLVRLQFGAGRATKKTRLVSIPTGSITVLRIRYLQACLSCVSIPTGSITVFFAGASLIVRMRFQFQLVRLQWIATGYAVNCRIVSIPTGSITVSVRTCCVAGCAEFQFQLVRLQLTQQVLTT